MITAHYNHPSIYIWGILNECASDTEYGRECYSEQYELIKSLDPYRPRSSASCRFKTDICLGYPEVVSYNIYPKWYHDVPVEDYLDELYQWIQNESEGTGKPFLITEIGAGAIYGYRTPRSCEMVGGIPGTGAQRTASGRFFPGRLQRCLYLAVL